VTDWGLQSFSPDELRESSTALLAWLAGTGCTRVAIHFDVDTIDSNEIVLGLGAEPNGLTSAQVRRIVTDIDLAADVVGFTIAAAADREGLSAHRKLCQPVMNAPAIPQTSQRLSRL
jgi:arginase